MAQSMTLGKLLRRRRQQLELTQQGIARKVGVRANYIGYLERDMRRPSTAVLVKLAKVLDLDRQELFFLAHPQVRSFLDAEAAEDTSSAWQKFRSDKRLHTRQSITQKELRVLEAVSSLGHVQTGRDYMFILQAIRQAMTAD